MNIYRLQYEYLFIYIFLDLNFNYFKIYWPVKIYY